MGTSSAAPRDSAGGKFNDQANFDAFYERCDRIRKRERIVEETRAFCRRNCWFLVTKTAVTMPENVVRCAAEFCRDRFLTCCSTKLHRVRREGPPKFHFTAYVKQEANLTGCCSGSAVVLSEMHRQKVAIAK